MTAHYKKGYPRPQFVRDNWQLLDGEWSFAFDDSAEGKKYGWNNSLPGEMKIIVPFSYETKMSGIGDETAHNTVWYERMITLSLKSGMREIINFEGCDYKTTVYLNGKMVGQHTGGYTRFSFDVTDYAVNGENRLTVLAEDSLSRSQPRGKQRWKDENFGCWYVQTTGIWKSVWMEQVADAHLSSIKMTPFTAEKICEAEYVLNCKSIENTEVETVIMLDGKTVASERIKPDSGIFTQRIPLDEDGDIALWSPDKPTLYDVTLNIYENGELRDQVFSYFGMRSVEIAGSDILLNGKPIYLSMVLDQGYWPDSHLTPPTEEALTYDIDMTLALGFNGVRKHQKVEDERWYYWCDVKGLLVWHEMPSCYHYNDNSADAFICEWKDAVRQHYNHTSIITWVPLNESWGIEDVRTDRNQQLFTEAVYNITKTFDRFRPVIVNDGWEHTVSDIITLHDYESSGEKMADRYKDNLKEILENKISHNNYKLAFADGYEYHGQPVIVSEYGGIAIEGSEGWGYNDKTKDKDECVSRIDELTAAIRNMGNVCGFCYTQLTDVQQEVNGLMDSDHVMKFDIDRINKIML